MGFLKLLFGSSRRAKQPAAHIRLSTSRKFAIQYNREEMLLTEYENKILRR